MHYKLPLVLMPQVEGGYTVTSPLLPELVTEGDSVAEALDNVKDALAAVLELYEDLGRPLPGGFRERMSRRFAGFADISASWC